MSRFGLVLPNPTDHDVVAAAKALSNCTGETYIVERESAFFRLTTTEGGHPYTQRWWAREMFYALLVFAIRAFEQAHTASLVEGEVDYALSGVCRIDPVRDQVRMADVEGRCTLLFGLSQQEIDAQRRVEDEEPIDDGQGFGWDRWLIL